MTAVTHPASHRRIWVNLRQALVYIILLAGLIITLLPFIWLLASSFKTGTEIIQSPPTFFPAEPTTRNYEKIFNDPSLPLFRIYMNSTIVAVANVLAVLFTSSLVGFILAKYDFKGKNMLFSFFLVSMMIPAQVLMIPNYLILSRFGLTNSLWGLILLSFLSPFGIFMMRQFIQQTVPDELMDAARIDGANEFQIYWLVVMPQLGASLATLGTLSFMGVWNAYLWPMVVITDIKKRTLPIILTWFSNQHGPRPELVLAATVLVILPVLVVYIFFQRWIVRGFATSGLK